MGIMNYEERRELKKQITQFLADAGINQQTLKEMVREEIDKKVKRSIEQEIEKISENHFNGFKGYIRDRIDYLLSHDYGIRSDVKDVIRNSVIKVVFDKKVSEE